MSIEIKELKYTYSPGSPFAHKALDGINLSIPEGQVTAIIGQTGSGKSTLVQHLNGLLKVQEGSIDIAGYHLEPQMKLKEIKQLRKKVGLVFQFPEYQLFEETIGKDIAFGPINFGDTPEMAMEKAKTILPKVGLDESLIERSPFDLSGGQKRRVAIAGILVQDPEILVLDEPAAGLDPQGAEEMMNLFMSLNKEQGKTIILVSHDMEHVLQYCDNVIVLENGKVKTFCDTKTFFKHPEWMKEIGINPPGIVTLKQKLMENGFVIDPEIFDEEELAVAIESQVKSNG
ncbi:energy-coupling factor transporter ATPase [Ileibacterium valens]|uniref:Energy-coupling factor transporter ATP-binding protein EcfA2 n=1 Tax=Ileibacterium valens TaxID=1862668 RepID=A0A1U7NIE8_9FIRM|nr:energy-coupling factor transporter ATPase [Ileibacterium valens]OLU37587.1 energy-coupling factor transporter ATPase [Erysipelotrichaceae bacterium NYU-BL-F16]OLU41937.1 energy-coupling factor transporter ATPase [Erysipelotrichaceae bacterium NYU-BL-E8]OLU42228.1 energy-coupling factor transporter ATPase [Ileibacterium valens]